MSTLTDKALFIKNELDGEEYSNGVSLWDLLQARAMEITDSKPKAKTLLTIALDSYARTLDATGDWKAIQHNYEPEDYYAGIMGQLGNFKYQKTMLERGQAAWRNMN